MGLEPFTAEDPIFLDEDVLRDSHKPEDLIARDRELEEYQAALKPVIKGARPRNIFLYGQTGVGKTVATEMVMDRLRKDQENYDNLDIHVVHVVCKNLNSSYQVAVKLVNEFRDTNNKIPTTGYPPDTIYEFLWKHLREIDSTHVLFVLDEVDAIGNDDDILYELPRCNDNGNIPVEETKVGVIGISNKFTFRDNLSARVKDSLCDEEIHFPPYDANQLRNILYQRAENAFVDGVLEDDVVPLAAAFAGQESGSARQALKLLFKAGDIARSRDLKEVKEEHIREAEPKVKESQVRNELESVPTQSHLTLYALLTLEKQDSLPAKSSDIYDVYEIAANRIDTDVKTDRTIRDRLSQLKLKGFLDVEEHNEGPKGGSYYLYEFGDIRPNMVAEVLRDVDRLDDLFQTEITNY
ncbi:Cdc6/Cdc18 family protein [Natronorubrum sulfidifaciens]|uniref:ORC1-type DNA replication protein n=1 Tax=Natronorubrum sulfidifaciens JCM 14089 TaxID=1230460 RepID=L9VVH4_9EURY|nr:orc1/cdc6 family replication initiation protein [Natronorubrum sulfidifaciens]ELY41180.1 cell division control protein 6 [Natronorubrum sulfidifaciens JCM 14089]